MSNISQFDFSSSRIVFEFHSDIKTRAQICNHLLQLNCHRIVEFSNIFN